MNQKIEKMKVHLRENKKVYIAAVTGIVVGAVSVLVFKQYSGNKVTIDSWKLLQYKSPHTSQTVQVNIPKPGNSGNMIYCHQNDTFYPSIRSASKALDVNASAISQYIQGKWPAPKGYTFDLIAENGVPFAS